VTRGFLLGKFMPPHAGHLLLCEAAARLVDELTILVCWLPDDPIPGPLRLAWMRELLPGARVIGHGESVPQAPADSPDFWPVWRRIVAEAHPEPIDLLFAGESYGAELARQVGGTFVPLLTRTGGDGLSRLSGTAVRADPWAHWCYLPAPVRAYYARTICLHGPESVGKSMLAERLAEHFGTIAVPEYGRHYCETHGLDLTEADLLAIGRAQAALIEAGKRRCDRRLIADTDALMTAAWSAMLFDRVPDALLAAPKADLYLLLEPDVPWADDGTRLFGEAESRARFMAESETMLRRAGVRYERIAGDWDERFARAVAAVEALGGPELGAAAVPR
jgi:HTH-type transcriptional regulator, transcriptional repressor of NAD biosynthesis genes